jgi:integrase
MARKTLTDKSIRALKPAPAGQRYIVADAVVPGFGVRVTDRGHRTFVLGARYPGSKHFKRREIGEVGAITLALAREKAREWLVLIKAGKDPREVARTAGASTFRAVAEEYIARVQRTKRQGARVAWRLRREVVPLWGDRPIGSIERADVVHLIEAIAERGPAYARNIYDYLRGLFNWAINRGVYGLDRSPCDRLRPAELIGPRRARQRVLGDEELRALWHAAGAEGYPFGPCIQLLMLTGTRLNEAAGARWREFDAEVWTVPPERAKMDAEHRVPITDGLRALLEQLPRWNQGDRLFSTTSGATFVRGFSRVKHRLDVKMGPMPHWVYHDIRRTVRTRLSALRVPEPVAELVIGHSKRGLARVYDQHQYLGEMYEALEAWNRLLARIVDPAANVVELRGEMG